MSSTLPESHESRESSGCPWGSCGLSSQTGGNTTTPPGGRRIGAAAQVGPVPRGHPGDTRIRRFPSSPEASPVPRLLVVHHTTSPALQAMLEAAVAGARDPELDG